MFTFERAMFFWALLAAVPLVTSVAYFYSSPTETPISQRIAVSAHGIYIAALGLSAVVVAGLQLHQRVYGALFSGLCLVAAALICYSLWAFRGKKITHWWQAVNIAWLLALLLLGSMAVTGQWL